MPEYKSDMEKYATVDLQMKPVDVLIIKRKHTNNKSEE